MIVSKLSLYLLSVGTFGVLTLFAITTRSKARTDLDPEEGTMPRRRTLVMKKFQDLQPDSIFLLDTSFTSSLSDMTLCALESAAYYNPGTVTLLRTNPELEVSPQLERLLLERHNVFILHLEADAFLRATPLQTLIRSGKLQQSVWPEFHLSDVLRVALLNKYGGTYLDSDAVSIRALPDAPNFVVIEKNDSIANGLLRFQPGHPVILKVMRKLDSSFDPEGWSTNGPGLFTEAIRALCHLPSSANLTSQPQPHNLCHNVRAFDKDKFLLIGPKQFMDLVAPRSKEEITEQLYQLEEKSFSTHLWGHRFRMHNITFDFASFNDSQLVFAIGKRFCPTVFNTSRYRSSGNGSEKETYDLE